MLEHVGDVVEAVGGIVGRQQRRRVHLEIEQIADRVRVLGAIQPIERRAAGIRLRGRRTIQRGRQRRDERGARLRIRMRHAGRRHHPGSHLSDDLFPDLRVSWNVGGVEVGQYQPAGLGAFVVAGGAVLLDDRADDSRRLCGGHRAGRRSGPRLSGRGLRFGCARHADADGPDPGQGTEQARQPNGSQRPCLTHPVTCECLSDHGHASYRNRADSKVNKARLALTLAEKPRHRSRPRQLGANAWRISSFVRWEGLVIISAC